MKKQQVPIRKAMEKSDLIGLRSSAKTLDTMVEFVNRHLYNKAIECLFGHRDGFLPGPDFADALLEDMGVGAALECFEKYLNQMPEDYPSVVLNIHRLQRMKDNLEWVFYCIDIEKAKVNDETEQIPHYNPDLPRP